MIHRHQSDHVADCTALQAARMGVTRVESASVATVRMADEEALTKLWISRAN